MVSPSPHLLPTRLSVYSFFKCYSFTLASIYLYSYLVVELFIFTAASQKKFASLHLVQYILFVFGDIRDILSSSCLCQSPKDPHFPPLLSSAAKLALISAPEDDL